jgi:poly(hydroxyalkanoate) granule-associated protein
MAKKVWQDDVKVSAQKIWLAGLGALAVAEEEGSKLFKNLVREGEKYGEVGKETVKTGVSGAKKGFDEAATKAKKSAEETWSKIEGGLDERLAKTLHRIGVPTRDEISALSRRVEELTAALDRMRQKEAPSARAAGAPAASPAARARATAAKPPVKAAKPARPAVVAKPAAPKTATPKPAAPSTTAKPAATRVGAKPAAKPAAVKAAPKASATSAPVPEKITTSQDVTTTADVKTGPR